MGAEHEQITNPAVQARVAGLVEPSNAKAVDTGFTSADQHAQAGASGLASLSRIEAEARQALAAAAMIGAVKKLAPKTTTTTTIRAQLDGGRASNNLLRLDRVEAVAKDSGLEYPRIDFPADVANDPPELVKQGNRPENPWFAHSGETALTASSATTGWTYSSLIGPRKLLLVCLFTGGEPGKMTATDQSERVQAVETTWGGVDVYWVTHMPGVNRSRQIKLPEEAETGGYKGIWKKTLHLFHYLTHSDLGEQYDFVFKGDDDTLVNLQQMREVLSGFDPAIPVYLGNNLYGVGCRGVAPTSPFFWQNKGIAPCHGGAGYALSRGLLQILAPHFLRCAVEWPSSTYEDATMAFCVSRHAAVGCTGMKRDFGWDRYHNAKREMVPMKIQKLEQDPVLLATATSFHPVPPTFQARIHSFIAKVRAEQWEAVRDKTENELLGTSKRYLIAQWNCTLPRTRPPLTGQLLPALNALCQQYPLKRVPLGGSPREPTKAVRKLRKLWFGPAAPAGPQFPNGGAAFDAVVVVLDHAAFPPGFGPVRSASLVRLVKTLRATGSMAAVVLMVPTGNSTARAAAQAAAGAADGVEIHDLISPIGEFELPGFGITAHLVSQYLSANRGLFRQVLVASSDVFFQRNPFDGSIPARNGTLLSVTENFPSDMTAFEPNASNVFTHMGICSKRDRQLYDRDAAGEPRKGPNWYYFRGPGLVDPAAIFGTAIAVEVALTEVIHGYLDVPKQLRQDCRGEQVLSRAVFVNKAIAERVPVTVPAVGTSPVVNLGGNSSSLWSIANGEIVNKRGEPAVVVVAPNLCLCCATATGYTDGRKYCPSAVIRLQ